MQEVPPGPFNAFKIHISCIVYSLCISPPYQVILNHCAGRGNIYLWWYKYPHYSFSLHVILQNYFASHLSPKSCLYYNRQKNNIKYFSSPFIHINSVIPLCIYSFPFTKFLTTTTFLSSVTFPYLMCIIFLWSTVGKKVHFKS